MKVLKTGFIAIMLLFSTTLFAQDAPKKQHHINRDSAFAKFSERLKLTADQQARMKETMKTNHAEMKAVREANKNADKAVKRKAALAQLKKNDERIKAILDESQKAEYEKIKTEKKEQMKARHKQKKRANGNQPKPDLQDQDIDDELL